MNVKRPRKLDLNAPLMSTRRVATFDILRTNSVHDSCERVPFSWEQSPGKPKLGVRGESFRYEGLPLPKPPTIRWQEEAYTNVCPGDDHENMDINNNNNRDDYDALSDGIDLFSLAPSLNASERPDKESAREDTDIESDAATGGNQGSSSPNFMIQRFLPAATALAASSLSALGARVDQGASNHLMEGSCVPRVTRQLFSSSRGCGFELLFPWRTKHKLSKIRSPVRRVHPSLKPQLGPKNK